GLNEESVINPGDKLTIRLADGQAPPPTPTPPAYHVVREGESLWVIAAYYKTDLATLLWLNGLPEDAVVHPGNEVKVRLVPGEAPPPTPTPQLTHIVKSGDTAWGIALSYGLTLDELAAFNHISPDALLQIGQELMIRPPTATPEPTTTPTPTATPEIVNLAAVTPIATSSPVATAVAMIAPKAAVAEPTGLDVGNVLGIGALIAGLALTLLAGVAILFLWRNDT
ncbi:MAG: LysM peptidoglycan-binding domain-containing protein, partial [Anaerolineales bacterium]|nr:LysM peptidoglycan-binding domain-containing protein [Anaerolineales bacterium]